MYLSRTSTLAFPFTQMIDMKNSSCWNSHHDINNSCWLEFWWMLESELQRIPAPRFCFCWLQRAMTIELHLSVSCHVAMLFCSLCNWIFSYMFRDTCYAWYLYEDRARDKIGLATGPQW